MNDWLLKMKAYYNTRATYSYEFRRQQLLLLKKVLLQHEQEIYEALYTDLKKSPEECWVTELGFVVAEINYALKHLAKWMKQQKVKTNLLNFPSKSYIVPEPLGVVLIIGPWNYPFQLVLAPLVGAIAAGNTAVIKPSELASASAALIDKILSGTFDKQYLKVVQGEGAEVVPELMNRFRFDHVFYTGSTAVGRLVYQMAATQLVPVTLELGGKSPCIVERDADIKTTAKRIAVTKFSNAGQMCVAPDYVLVHQHKKEALISELKNCIEHFYDAEEVRLHEYGKLVNKKQHQRLVALMNEAEIMYGGNYNEESLFIQPTLLQLRSLQHPLMQEEIFGPLLPIISWQHEEEVHQIIKELSNPLALYIFTNSKHYKKKWIQSLAFGGGCINNASWHLTNPHLPFGGRGNSGTGQYHGYYSFRTFSHQKAIMDTPTWFDPSIKYPPFRGKLKWIKKIIG